MFLLFVLQFSQRVSSHSRAILRELLHHPLELLSCSRSRSCQLPTCSSLANGLKCVDACKLLYCENRCEDSIEEFVSDNSDKDDEINFKYLLAFYILNNSIFIFNIWQVLPWKPSLNNFFKLNISFLFRLCKRLGFSIAKKPLYVT